MRRMIAATLLCMAACGDGGGDDDPPPTGELACEVVRYEYAVDLTTRAASSRVILDVVEPGDCLTIGFRASRLEDVRLDGAPIKAGELRDGELWACGAGWEAGAQIALESAQEVPAETWEDSQVGFSARPDLEGADFTYLVSWVGGCDRFGPCDAHPARFATYRFEVTHPSGTQVLCPGEVMAGDQLTVCDFDLPGGPTYSTFGVAASPSWFTVDLGTWDGVRVTLYDTPSSGTADAYDPAINEAFLTFMQDRFGPFPYGDELRLIFAPTYWRGFEHPGSIVLSDRLVLGPGTFDYADPLTHVINHEIAHQWAGDQTTLADVYDFAWKEAMVEYITYVFEDETQPATVPRRTLSYWKALTGRADWYPVPGERPELIDYYGDVYGAGSLILFRQVEGLFGRDAVMAALAELLGEPRTLSMAEVQDALERATGADLEVYFQRWVYGEGAPAWPHVAVDITGDSPGELTVTATQIVDDDGGWFGCAFAIELTGDGDETAEVWIDYGPDGAETVTETVTVDFPVTGHVVDRGLHCAIWEQVGSARAARERVPHPWSVER